MKVLFLHGWHSVPGGVKPTYLADHGCTVLNPAIDDDDFVAAVATAQAVFDAERPDVVVGSSRGGAAAMNLKVGSTPLVLLCPAWKRWGAARKIKPGDVVLHARADETIPYEETVELISRSGLERDALIDVGIDHRLADPEPLEAMLLAVQNACRRMV
ncbi:MAG: alpha/beta fold hydrolase [Planctomycetia bacterium]